MSASQGSNIINLSSLLPINSSRLGKGLSQNKSLKKIIIKDQINNLSEARKLNNLKMGHKILNSVSKIYYNLKLLFV